MKKYLPELLLSIALLAILSITNSWKVFNYPPRSEHQWRQSDCSAYVKTYYRNNTGLFSPGTYYLGGKEGKVVSEFPLLYYLTAKIEKLVGEHYWVMRGICFICFVSGLFALLSCIKIWIPNAAYSILPVVLLATSPYYYFYAINFLPNVPAISFSFIGLYFFLLYRKNNRVAYLAIGTAFFLLAVLLKPTDGGIIWFAFLLTWTFQHFAGSAEKKFRTAVPMFVSGLIIVSCLLYWIRFVNSYNNENGNHQNLVGIYPIWEMRKDIMVYTIKRVFTEWTHVFQQKIVLWFLLGCFIVFIIKWKYLDSFLRLFTAFLILGVITYAILWFKAFTDHDYYQLPYVLAAVFLSVTVVEFFVNKILPKLPAVPKTIIAGILSVLVLMGIHHNRNIQLKRYDGRTEGGIAPAFFDLEPYLERIGIQYSDIVVCVPDQSPNSALNAINRYGYSEAFNNETYNINYFQSKGASFLIISDSSYLSNPLYQPFTKKQIGYFKGIFVFDIRKY